MLVPEDYKSVFDTSLKAKKKHVCSCIADIPNGRWRCISEHNFVKHIPQQGENFKFRDKEVSKILNMILAQNKRLVSLLGLRGVGKSSIAKSVMHYAAERKIFPGGIIFIKLKDINSCVGVVKKLMGEIMRKLSLSKQE